MASNESRESDHEDISPEGIVPERDILRELEDERELRIHYENLLRINPDTTLPIYRELLNDLSRLCQRSEENGFEPFHVVIIRLDSAYQAIKNTKDRSKAILFRTTIRIREVVGGGLYQSDRLDEFILLITGHDPDEDLTPMFRSIIREVGLPHEWNNSRIAFSCNMGSAMYPRDGRNPMELLGASEIALRAAVQLKKPLVRYRPSIGEVWQKGQQIAAELARACQTGFPGFRMVYQPFVDSGGMIRGCESLVRWTNAEGVNIPPPRFIPVAERTGDIRLLGRWILYQSLVQLARWHKDGHEVFVSVNLSPAQFVQKDLVESIHSLLDSTGVPGTLVKLEITEGVLMHDPSRVIDRLHALKSLGLQLSIDDFGTGYSSLNYLRHLPVSTLKIDKSFVDHLEGDPHSRAIAKTIIALARGLGMKVLAEGVETMGQKDFLISEGCDWIQGYLYSRPVEAGEFLGLLHGGALLEPGKVNGK